MTCWVNLHTAMSHNASPVLPLWFIIMSEHMCDPNRWLERSFSVSASQICLVTESSIYAEPVQVKSRGLCGVGVMVRQCQVNRVFRSGKAQKKAVTNNSAMADRACTSVLCKQTRHMQHELHGPLCLRIPLRCIYDHIYKQGQQEIVSVHTSITSNFFPYLSW